MNLISYVDFSSKVKLASVSNNFLTLFLILLAVSSETLQGRVQGTNPMNAMKGCEYFQIL